jgi:hypothetical protein
MRRAVVALPATLLLALQVARAPAADPSGAVEATMDVRVGVADVFKVGRWTPLEVLLHPTPAADLRLEVEAPDPDGATVTYHSEPLPIRFPPGGKGDSEPIGLLFKMGRLDGTLRVRVLDGDHLVSQKALRVGADPDANVKTPFRQSVFLVANVQAAREGGATNDLIGRPGVRELGQLLSAANDKTAGASGAATRTWTEVVDFQSFAALPTRAAAYDSFDAVILTGRFDLDAARSRALEQWVRSGGQLLISIGGEAQDFAKKSAALAAWLPVNITGTVKLRDLSPIESFCRQSSRIMAAAADPLDAARLSAPGGRELVPSLAGPLLCRAAYGLGHVTVFGLDLNAPALASWSAAPDLVQRLFGVDESLAEGTPRASNRLSQTGISELATQLDGALDEIPRVSRFTIWHVMGLLAALLLVVGPLDFLLVHKLLRRPELTWVTFPLLALVAAGSAVYWGYESKGKQMQLNQLDVFDVDANSGWIYAHSYSLIYSPENRRFNVTADADAPQHAPTFSRTAATPKAETGTSAAASSTPATSPQVSWRGRPEASFGGMYRTAGVEIARPSYDASAGSRQLDELPIAVWSTKSLESEWSMTDPGLVDSQLESRGLGHLGGTLRHHFPGPIEDWIVAYGHQVFYPRFDAHGQPLPLLPDMPWAPQSASQRELSGYLTGATQTMVTTQGGRLEEMRTEHEDYDPVNRDPLRILRMLTFHNEAGGTVYTGLGNGALRQFDWSPLLDLNRAVLVGRVRRPLTRWKVDGQAVEPDQSFTFVRVVLPVKQVRYHEEN